MDCVVPNYRHTVVCMKKNPTNSGYLNCFLYEYKFLRSLIPPPKKKTEFAFDSFAEGS